MLARQSRPFLWTDTVFGYVRLRRKSLTLYHNYPQSVPIILLPLVRYWVPWFPREA